MSANEYIDSGLLELYVYGLLSDEENLEISKLADENKEVDDEIVAIEKAIIHLSSSFSPFLSAENFEKIRQKLELKYGKVVEMKPRSNMFLYIGWAACLLLLLGSGYFYNQWQTADRQLVTTINEKSKLEDNVVDLEIRNKGTETALSIVRDNKNTVVALGGQAVSPQSFAKIYWNKDTKAVYVDAAGLPDPPKGKVYQVWALKLNPLTPTSIGLLENFTTDNKRFFAVDNASGAEAFGITLEPAGGSVSPTLDQLYTMGKV
jgi:anti-sigma-K factor RskA